jgi:hypothetical protein
MRITSLRELMKVVSSLPAHEQRHARNLWRRGRIAEAIEFAEAAC